MLALAATVLAVLVLLVSSEIWWRRQRPSDEISRKFVHITVGTMAALWPFYLSWGQIAWLGIAFVAAVALSKYFNIFQAIHAVQRPTWGEICFALAVGGLTMITHDRWIYAAALLHMSLADGLAAIAGTRFGKRTRYMVLGHTKSIAGTATFFAMSVLILTWFDAVHSSQISVWLIAALAGAATVVENAGIWGLDNLMVPMLIALALRQLS